MSSAEKSVSKVGKFKFKGDKKKKKNDKGATAPSSSSYPIEMKAVFDKAGSSASFTSAAAEDSEDEYLTATQRSQKRKEREMESKTAEEHAAMGYRERINKFNQKLATATEHNDIPRISAAGNG